MIRVFHAQKLVWGWIAYDVPSLGEELKRNTTPSIAPCEVPRGENQRHASPVSHLKVVKCEKVSGAGDRAQGPEIISCVAEKFYHRTESIASLS
jgi:hypothetical protein